MPNSYPNAPQPIGPPSGSVLHSNTAQSSIQDQPMHKTSTSDLGGVAVDPPVRPSYQPQQDLHSNGGTQHDTWGAVSSKPSSAGSVPGTAASQSGQGLSQQGNFGQSSQHQGPQQNLGPSLLSSLNAQSSSGPSTSDALHSMSGLSNPSLSTSTAADTQGHNSFQQDRNSQYSMLPNQVDQLQMQFGQVQLNGNEFGNSGFGTGFGPSSSQGHAQESGNSLEDMSFLRQQPQLQHQQPQLQHQQPQQQSQQQSQQASRAGSDAATSTADGLIQQHRPTASSDYQSSNASRGFGAFPQSHTQPATSRAVPASQSGPASVSAGIQTESSSLGDTAGGPLATPYLHGLLKSMKACSSPCSKSYGSFCY